AAGDGRVGEAAADDTGDDADGDEREQMFAVHGGLLACMREEPVGLRAILSGIGPGVIGVVRVFAESTTALNPRARACRPAARGRSARRARRRHVLTTSRRQTTGGHTRGTRWRRTSSWSTSPRRWSRASR